MPEENAIKLIKAVKELNIGMGTIVDFFAQRGYRVDKQPMARISADMYAELKKAFSDENRNFQLSNPPNQDDHISPSVYARKLIEECITEKAISLDLGHCGLVSSDWDQGGALDLALRKCTHLSTLILANEYSQYDQTHFFPKVQVSKNPGNPNFLTEIPVAVRSLRQLKMLICCGDAAESWHIDSLTILSNHVQLQYLDVSYNQISSLKDIKKLSALETFVINNNRIRFINNVLKLPQLSNAYLQYNIIEKLPVVQQPSPVTYLNLNHNSINELPGLDNLDKLRELHIRENHINNIDHFTPLIWKPETFFLNADENPFVQVFQLKLSPSENHLPFIVEVINRRRDDSEKIPIRYPVKILMFGNHSVGKSTLVDRFTHERNQGSTHILRIVNLNYFPENNPLLPDAIFFDFGGQDFYHGVYRAFVSEYALQLILFDQTTDANKIDQDKSGIPNVNLNRQYWLGQKNYQEKGKTTQSPYILIQTHIDKVTSEPTPLNYQHYPGLLHRFDLSLSKDDSNEISHLASDFYIAGLQYFGSYLVNIIDQLQTTTVEPIWYVKFLQYIVDRDSKDHQATALEDILTHYRPARLSYDERKKSLINNLIQLHRFGLILYYPDIPGLENICWLNPQKLVEHIQHDLLSKTFADARHYKSPGVISKKAFERMITDETIILLLKAQNVIFLHNPTGRADEQEYIVPNYLPLLQPNDIDLQLLVFGLEKPNFVIKFEDFIPFGFINQMICFFGKLPDIKRFWRNRLLFTINREIRVLIDLDFEQLKIKVNFQCLTDCRFSASDISEYLFFSIIGLYWNYTETNLFTFEEFAKYQKLPPPPYETELQMKCRVWQSFKRNQDFVPDDAYLSVNDRDFVSYIDLFSLAEDAYTIDAYEIVQNNINTLNTKVIPVNAFEPFTEKKLASMKKIFVSYSKFDEDYLQEFEDHLVTLKREGVATFNCKKIEFGKEWDEEIKKQIDECDIMVCLISVKFLNTDYITNIEIPKAIEQNKLIIPIIIKACDWENSALGKFQVAQRGKIVSIDNSKRLFGETRAQTREERDVFWTDVIKEFRVKIDFFNN